jgi:hypothetical protein
VHFVLVTRLFMLLLLRTSIVAGLLAAVGSGVGKLSFDGDSAMTRTLAAGLERRCAAVFLSSVSSSSSAAAAAAAAAAPPPPPTAAAAAATAAATAAASGVPPDDDDGDVVRDGGGGPCGYVGYVVRGAFAVLMLVLNGTMLGLYVRAMQEEGSVVATVINMAASFLGTGVLGVFVFGEPLRPMWCVGATCMAFGVFLVAKAAPNSMIDVEVNGTVGQSVQKKDD